MTQPAIPFERYADGVLQGLAGVAADVLPYAAAITAFVIGVGMVHRWLGHRSATSMGASPGRRSDDYDDDGFWERKVYSGETYDKWESSEGTYITNKDPRRATVGAIGGSSQMR